MARQTFSLQLKAFAEKAKGRANFVVRKVLFDVATSLVEKSPVGDGKYWINKPPPGYVGGRFRANWQFGEGTLNTLTIEKVDPEGDATIGRITAAIPDEATGKVFFITNSLPYAQRIEDGWSHRQAPMGVVGITWVEWRDFLANAVREAKQQ